VIFAVLYIQPLGHPYSVVINWTVFFYINSPKCFVWLYSWSNWNLRPIRVGYRELSIKSLTGHLLEIRTQRHIVLTRLVTETRRLPIVMTTYMSSDFIQRSRSIYMLEIQLPVSVRNIHTGASQLLSTCVEFTRIDAATHSRVSNVGRHNVGRTHTANYRMNTRQRQNWLRIRRCGQAIINTLFSCIVDKFRR